MTFHKPCWELHTPIPLKVSMSWLPVFLQPHKNTEFGVFGYNLKKKDKVLTPKVVPVLGWR